MSLIQRLISFIYPIQIEKRTGSSLPTLEVNMRKGKYILDGERVNYSFGALHELFRHAFHNYRMKEKPVQDVLILGFGAGSVTHILTNELKLPCRITGVEKDPVVLELAEKYFGLGQLTNTTVKCMDADTFITSDRAFYDLIVIDLFVENRVPENFQTEHFFSRAFRRLRSDGIIFYNHIHDSVGEPSDVKFTLETMKEGLDIKTETILFSRNGTTNCLLVGQKKANHTIKLASRKITQRKMIGYEAN